MSSEGNQCEIKCPVCGKAKTITIPPEILATRKMGLMKVNIDIGVCCEHQFIVFVSKSLKAAGYEKMDLSMDISSRPQEPELTSLREMVKNYGKENVAKFVQTFLMDSNIVFIEYDDLKVDLQLLNQSFNVLLPENLRKNNFVISIPVGSVKKNMAKYAAVFDPKKKTFNSPWNKKTIKGELGLIDYAATVLDDKTLPIFMQEVMRIILEKAEFGKTYLEHKESTTEKEFMGEIKKIFGDWRFPNEWYIILAFLSYRLMVDISKIRGLRY